jgi:hypothetical protein
MRLILLAAIGAMGVLGPTSASFAEYAPLNLHVGFEAVPFEPLACWPFPPWYPWELVVHTPCPPGYYVPQYFKAEYQQRPWRHPYGALNGRPFGHSYVLGPVHHRPYLRPGWWW